MSTSRLVYISCVVVADIIYLTISFFELIAVLIIRPAFSPQYTLGSQATIRRFSSCLLV